jgi:PilZ domain-containing protein
VTASSHRMLQILTFDTPSLVSALRSGHFRRAGLRLTTASDARELFERAAVLRPNVIVLVAGRFQTRRESGLARDLRPHLADGRSLILLALPQDGSDLVGDLGLYDGLIALEEPALDLARALEQMAALTKRRESRARVEIPTQLLAAGHSTIDGVTLDLSDAGAKLRVAHAPVSELYEIRFHRRPGHALAIGARIVWIDAYARQDVPVGVRFVGATLETLRGLHDLASRERAIYSAASR